MYKATIVALCAASLISGCATITRGTTNTVTFTSDPEGANVTTTDGQTCITPCEMDFSRKEDFVATFELDGETREVDVRSEVAATGVGAMVGNVVAGGIIGVGIDAVTGANLDHFPDPVHADFTPETTEEGSTGASVSSFEPTS